MRVLFTLALAMAFLVPAYHPTGTPATEADDTCYNFAAGDNYVEAEFPTTDDTSWTTATDTNASNDTYRQSPDSDNLDVLSYCFTIPATSNVHVWARAIKAPNTSNGFKFGLDTGPMERAAVTSTSWAWFLDDDASFTSVTSGAYHTFKVSNNSTGVKFDKLLFRVSSSAGSAPSGEGGVNLPPHDVKLTFGFGATADGVLAHSIADDANLGMLTTWFNGTGDLSWQSEWADDLIPDAYDAGYAHHLIIYSNDAEVNLTTAYGPACGRAYPLSAQFQQDVQDLAEIWTGQHSGHGPLYVTMFTEFQTYPCTDNQWVGAQNYYNALIDAYIDARDTFHAVAPNSQVSIGWGGWQASWTDTPNGGGTALVESLEYIMDNSDFVSVQLMESSTNTNPTHLNQMASLLWGLSGKPLMVAHYKPDNGSQTTFDADVAAMMTDNYLTPLVRNYGLFAFSFMDRANIDASGTTYTNVKNAINRYGE